MPQYASNEYFIFSTWKNASASGVCNVENTLFDTQENIFVTRKDLYKHDFLLLICPLRRD